MPEQQSKTEAEIKKPDKQVMTRRGFFQIFKKSGLVKEDEEKQEADESEKPELSFKEKLTRQLKYQLKFTRRNVIQALGVLTAFIALDSGSAFYSDLNTSDDYDYEALEQIDFLKKRYSCELEFGMPLHMSNDFLEFLEKLDIRFGFLSLEEKKQSLKLLREQLALYPPEYIQAMKPIMILTKYDSLFYSAGYSFYKNRNYIIFFDMPFFPERAKDLVHHELYHASDYNNGELEADNKEWGKLNEGEVDYSSFWQVHDFLSTFTQDLDVYHPRGFADHYSMKNADEDEATIMAKLMSHGPEFEESAEKDHILKNKIEKMKEYMYQRTNGRMNEQYWKDLAAGKVDEKYWD
jgi:hypothetical protein